MKYSKLNRTDAVPTFMPGTIKPICILDDDSSVLNSLLELLESDGFEARTFDDPDKFLAYAQQHRIELAVLDLWMPEANGIEVQERLRELSPNTRIIVITGREEAAIRTAALAGGAFAFWLSRSTTRRFSHSRVTRFAKRHDAQVS